MALIPTQEELDDRRRRQRAEMKDIAERERTMQMGPRYSDAEVMNFASSLGVAPGGASTRPLRFADAGSVSPGGGPSVEIDISPPPKNRSRMPSAIRGVKTFPVSPEDRPQGAISSTDPLDVPGAYGRSPFDTGGRGTTVFPKGGAPYVVRDQFPTRSPKAVRRQGSGPGTTIAVKEQEPYTARNYALSQVPGAMRENAPEDAGNVAHDVTERLMHPVETAKDLWRYAQGIEEANREFTQEPGENAKRNTFPTLRKWAMDLGVDTYTDGSLRFDAENFKRRLAEHPAQYLLNFMPVGWLLSLLQLGADIDKSKPPSAG